MQCMLPQPPLRVYTGYLITELQAYRELHTNFPVSIACSKIKDTSNVLICTPTEFLGGDDDDQ